MTSTSPSSRSPPTDVEAVVAQAAAKGVHGLVVVSEGFAETGEAGGDLQRRLVRAARGAGMRVVGPNSFGLLVTDPEVSLNASLSPVMPPRGRLGFFAQSGALGVALLDNAAQRGLGISSFVSAGNRVDVSGNDLMQFWEDDPSTDAVMLYLETIGNPRKFSRVARRLSRRKPVVVVKSGRARSHAPHGHLVRESTAPAAAVDALFRGAGVIRVDTIHAMFDVGALVAHQPLPAGRRVAIVGNSDALAVLAADACEQAGLEVVEQPHRLSGDADAGEFSVALGEVFARDDVDSVVALFIPPPATPHQEVAGALAHAAGSSAKTVVSTFLGMRGLPMALRDTSGASSDDAPERSVPSYPTPEDAVRALAAVTDYAGWRATPAGNAVVPSGLDVRAARDLVAAALPEGSPESVALDLDQDGLGALLACYGIELWPTLAAVTVADAVAAAAVFGYPVALKTTAAHLRHRSDLGAVPLNIDDEPELLGAYAAMAQRLGPEAAEHFVVQRMAPTGVACVLRSVEDPLFGPVVSFGLGGVATELLDDWSHGIPPADRQRPARSGALGARGTAAVRAPRQRSGGHGAARGPAGQGRAARRRPAGGRRARAQPGDRRERGAERARGHRAAGPATGAHRPGRASTARLTSARELAGCPRRRVAASDLWLRHAGRVAYEGRWSASGSCGERPLVQTRRACRVRRSLVSVGESRRATFG